MKDELKTEDVYIEHWVSVYGSPFRRRHTHAAAFPLFKNGKPTATGDYLDLEEWEFRYGRRDDASVKPVKSMWKALYQELTDQANEAGHAEVANIKQLTAESAAGDELAKTTLALKAMGGGIATEYEDVKRDVPEWRFINLGWCKNCCEAMASKNRNYRFCSNKCKKEYKREMKKYWMQYNRPSRAKERTAIDCETCGESFTPARSDARYCSVKCRVAAHRAKSPIAE